MEENILKRKSPKETYILIILKTEDTSRWQDWEGSIYFNNRNFLM